MSKSGRGRGRLRAARLLHTQRAWATGVSKSHHSLGRPRESLARELGPDVGCVIALGGDTVNEVVNGLMARSRSRPPWPSFTRRLSGNDYAETLGMAYSVPTAVTGSALPDDAGRRGARQQPLLRGVFSFGLNAAIALNTVDRRQKSRARGHHAFWPQSAVDQLFHHFARRSLSRWTSSWGGAGLRPHPGMGRCYLVAVQVGPTYGGHFRITPKGAPRRIGLLDICWATPGLSPMRALALLCAPGAASTRATTTFTSGGRPPSCSTSEAAGPDGWEPLFGTLVIDCVPDALTVVVGQR